MTRLIGRLLLLTVLIWNGRASATSLDDYVAAPDASYAFSLVSTLSGAGYTGYIIDMTSQTWRSPTELAPQVWQHYVTLIVPTVLDFSDGLLLIDGGSNGGAPPTSVDPFLALAAVQTRSVIVELRMIPNQPLQFSGEAFTRSEDAIIAKTFRLFLDGGDAEWPLMLPMVKSAVRAMDTAQTFLPTVGVTLNQFVVLGASKRGWTTWLTSAVDSRVRAIIPLVFDALNLGTQLVHHKQVYQGVTDLIVGGFSFALEDYVNEGIPDDLGTPQGDALLQIVDPYSYRSRLAGLPKYMVNGTGDEFFVPDSAQFYFNDLPGQNYLRYVPNVGHGLSTEAALNAIAFYQAQLAGATLPNFSWSLPTDGSILVQTIDVPLGVTLWQATNPLSRDFRLPTFGPQWTSSTLLDQGGGVYLAQPAQPVTGATAFMVELVYDVGGASIPFTTQIRVLEAPAGVPGLPLGAALVLAGLLGVSAWALLRAKNSPVPS